MWILIHKALSHQHQSAAAASVTGVCDVCAGRCAFSSLTWILGRALYLLSHLAGSPHKILTGTWDETGGYFEGQKSKMREEARTTDADIIYIQNSACDDTHPPKLHIDFSTATNL